MCVHNENRTKIGAEDWYNVYYTAFAKSENIKHGEVIFARDSRIRAHHFQFWITGKHSQYRKEVLGQERYMGYSKEEMRGFLLFIGLDVEFVDWYIENHHKRKQGDVS